MRPLLRIPMGGSGLRRCALPPILSLAAMLLLAACDKDEQKPAAPPPTPEVGVITVRPQSVPVVTVLPGRVSPFLVAEVRARVDGIVLRRAFAEGSDVTEGQILYKIDPAPYQAALDSARARRTKATANLMAAHALALRSKPLVESRFISRQDYDNAVSAEGQAAADVAAGNAAVETAEINLGYTDVKSPIAGRIGISR